MTTSTNQPPKLNDLDNSQQRHSAVGFEPRRLVLLIALLLTGLSAGFFFTYEASVTRGLAIVDDVSYVQTFQAINATIRNPAFAVVFFGPIVMIAAAITANWKTSSQAARFLLVSGFGLYLTCVLITFSGNVPLNNELAELTVVTPESAREARLVFEQQWNRLDLWRSLAAGASFVALAVASFIYPPTGHSR